MLTISREVLIDRPPEEVFAFINDPAKTPLWHTGVLDSRLEGDGPMGKGSRVTETRTFLGRRIETTIEVTEFDPPRRSKVHVVSGPIPGDGSYTVEPANGGSRFIMVLRFDPGGFFKLAQPVLARMAEREFATATMHLKDLLEAANVSD